MPWEWEIPQAAIRRISAYVSVLRRLAQDGKSTVFSSEIADLANTSSAQVRKDLSHFGEFGRRGMGYPVKELRENLLEVLGLDRQRKVIVMGAGNLGSALAGYPGFEQHGLRIVGIFDNDPEKIGRKVHGHEILAPDQLDQYVGGEGIELAIVAVPAAAAQDAIDGLVDAGIKCILNFAPIQVRTPPDVMVNTIDMTSELGVLSFYLARTRDGGAG